jgi:hypothetical protein
MHEVSATVQVLDFAFCSQGREMCSKFTRSATSLRPPVLDYGRLGALPDVGAVKAQGERQETLKANCGGPSTPSADGQRAFGQCLISGLRADGQPVVPQRRPRDWTEWCSGRRASPPP